VKARCEVGNEPSGSIKYWEVLERLRQGCGVRVGLRSNFGAAGVGVGKNALTPTSI
jgi:hypothetical protein